MRTATAIVTAIMLATSPAFAGGHGGHGHGGHGNASHNSSHATKADRQAAKAEHRADRAAAKAAKQAAVTISPGTWHGGLTYSAPGLPSGGGAFTMQPSGKFTYAPSDQTIKGKVNTRTGDVRGKVANSSAKIKGTYYDPLDGPDDTDRATMAGDILGKHGVTLGTWFAGGPELTEP